MKAHWLVLMALALFVACKKAPLIGKVTEKKPFLPENPYPYDDFAPPSHLQGGVYDFFNNTPQSNPVTPHGATLGRVLFYDKQLSANNTIACASCHHQEKAFSDGLQFSKGLYGGFTGRNSMAVFNAQYGFRFFWDLRANGLENQALMPIQHPVEMGMDLTALEQKLAGLSYYPELFENAFGDPAVTQQRIAQALAQFMRSIYSVNSKFDQGMAIDFANYTAQELHGKKLFFEDPRTNCNNCHQTLYFFDNSPHNNGLEAVSIDLGVGGISSNPSNIGKFKAPTLRNIEYTAPYMHDGRFKTLQEVIRFYNSGIQAHPNLDDRLTTTNQPGGPPRKMNLTDEDILALEAFLKTLSEPALLTNERWSDPFKD